MSVTPDDDCYGKVCSGPKGYESLPPVESAEGCLYPMWRRIPQEGEESPQAGERTTDTTKAKAGKKRRKRGKR